MTGSQIFNTVIEFFEEDSWNFHWLEGMSVLSVPFTGKNGRWMCYAQAREEQEQFVFYSVSPINVPTDRQTAIADFITRANYGMIIGNFEMDHSDGEVRYKTSIDVEGDQLTAPLVKQLVYANVIIMDRYLPGIMSVIYGAADPAAEIEKIEGPRTKESTTKLDDVEDIIGDHLNENVRSHIEDILRNIEENHVGSNGDKDEEDGEEVEDDGDIDTPFPPASSDDNLN